MCQKIASDGSCGHLIRVETQSCQRHFEYLQCHKSELVKKQLPYTCDDYLEYLQMRQPNFTLIEAEPPLVVGYQR